MIEEEWYEEICVCVIIERSEYQELDKKAVLDIFKKIKKHYKGEGK